MARHTDNFLQNGGETGELIRNIDWESTALGLPSSWPMPLKKAVNSILNTTVPTHICWGPDHIQFYNDPFIPSFGSTRHPSALGTAVKSNSQMWSTVEPLFARVMAGEHICMQDMKIRLDKNGFTEQCFMDIHYSPIRLDDWSVGGIQAVVIETTDKVNALHQSAEVEFKLLSLIEKAPLAICLFVGKDMQVELANDTMLKFWGKGAGIIGQPLAKAVPELVGQPFIQLLDNVFTTGETFEAKAAPAQLEIDGVLGTYYFDFSYIAIRNSSGEIYGVMDIATDVTQQVLAQRELEEQQSKLDFAIEAAQLGTWNLNPITNKFTGNNRVKAWFGLPPESEIDLRIATDVIAGKDRATVVAAIEKAMNIASGGHYDIEYSIIHPTTGKETIVRAKGKALFNDEGIAYQFSGTLQDVTEESNIKKQLALEVSEQRIAKDKLEESELFVNSVIYNSPVANLVLDGMDKRVKIVNENMLELIGRDDSILGKRFDEIMPELRDTAVRARIERVRLTGETFFQPEERISLVRYGKPYTGYYSYIYKALRLVSGEIYGVMATATEITEQVTARQKIEAKEKELRDLIRAAPIGICVVSGNPLWVEEVNDRFLLISGKAREEYQAKPYWEVLSEIAPMFERILDNVLTTGIKFTSEEHEMILIRDGNKEKIFATFEYVPVVDSENIVSKVIILAIEVSHQVQTRRQIEQAVEQRTRELAESNVNLLRSNSELEQFAYIASHDLQEPIRKISTFTQMLENSLNGISDRSKNYINKINSSAERMTKLIRDVLAFSQVSQNTGSFEAVDLGRVVQNIQVDYELAIQEKKARIKVSDMPVVQGDASQMTQLFSNLMSNSLKYVKQGISPIIEISSMDASKSEIKKHTQLDPGKQYYHIQFADNGIGFGQEHAEGIFNIFQRLHNKTDYEGTGIGLSICRKIVQVHNGNISASVGENGGAIFHIFLPQLKEKNK